MNADIKSVNKLAVDRLRSCWGNEIMVFLLNSAIIVLCLQLYTIVYSCFLQKGFISGDASRMFSESYIFAGVSIIIGIIAYMVSAPAYIGSCWWTIHYVRDESKDVKCLLSCYSSPKVFFRSIQIKLASDIPCTLLLAAVVGLHILCDRLFSSLGLNVHVVFAGKWLITLAALAAVYETLLRFAAVPYIYCLNHDASCIENIRHCLRLTKENKQLFREMEKIFIKSFPIMLLVMSCIFIFPYCSTLMAAVCLKMSESENVPETVNDNDIQDG